jgi:hypothetical protein
MKSSRPAGLILVVFFLVLLAGNSFGVTQEHTSATAPACRAPDIEILDEGAAAATGHDSYAVGLRNTSAHACTLFGTPHLEFLDSTGRSLTIPYARNELDFMWPKQPEKLVTVVPGGFAHFMIAITVGNQHLKFSSMRVVLPGQNTPLFVGDIGQVGVQSIDVSAVVEGVVGGFSPPTKRIPPSGVSDAGLSIRLSVSPNPQWGAGDSLQHLDAHFALRNSGRAPVVLKSANCTVQEELSNSAGETISAAKTCRPWEGETNDAGQLRPGDTITEDIPAVGDVDSIYTRICRAGVWHVLLTLKTPIGTVRYNSIPFQVNSTMCSDSLPSGIPAAARKAVHWEYFSHCGVRLGLALITDGEREPSTGKSFAGIPEPMLRAGQPVKLKVYLDNLSDAPLELRAGANAFRIVVRRSGQNEAADIVVPARAPAAGNYQHVTLSPHTWRFIQTIVLNDLYDLSPDDYDVIVGPLTLTGQAACANAAANGWPYTPRSAINDLMIKVIP